MAEKYKLALSRSRLFEPDNTVVFYGKCSGKLDENEVAKAMKMLSLKEKIITAEIELCDDASAYIVTGSFEAIVEFTEKAKDEIVADLNVNPIKFNEKLFRFYVSSDDFLIIAGHTAVCDAKSLLRLASYFISFYNKTDISIDENEIYTFSESKSLPVDVISPLTNKLSSELDDKWHKVSRSYTFEDYEAMLSEYFSNRSQAGELFAEFSAEQTQKMREYCQWTGVDLSSLFYFAFYKSILKNCKINKASSKMRIYADRRFFHGGNKNYSVGAYNGTVSIGLNKTELKKNNDEQLKAFHLDTYRALTSPFRVFYEDVLLMQVDASLCDSSYLALANVEKNKTSLSFAQNYGCMAEALCDCLYCNLNQAYWCNLQNFSSVMVFEPFKARSSKMISVAENRDGINLSFKFRKGDTDSEKAHQIIADAISIITSFEVLEYEFGR